MKRRDSTPRGDDRLSRHVVFDEEVELCRTRDLRARTPFRLDGELPIAPDAPPTFDGKYSELKWELELRFHLAEGPDWVQREGLFVLP